MTARSEEGKAEQKLAEAKAEQKLKEAEQKLAEAKAELKEAKAELKEAKAELKEAEQKLKEAEAKQQQAEQTLMETKQADPADAAEIQRLEQKLQTLNGDVAVLRKAFYSKSASVESKENVIRRLESQLLPAIAGPAFTSSGASQQDIERMLEANRKAVEETIQKQFAFQQRESVALSELSAGHFERIRQYVRMTVEPVEWSAILPTTSTASTSSTSATPAFQWSDENENQQYERYLSYLRSNLSVPRHLSVERAPPSLLDTFKSRYLPFDVRGTSDVMVVERASGITPVFGIRMLLELKKQRPDAKDVYQTMGELLAADQHTPFSPIVVLTDLAEYWRFCWLEGRQLRFCEAPSRDAAFRAIQAALDFSDQPQSAAAQAPFSKRRKLSDSILQDEERARQRRRSDEAAEMEEDDELSEDDEEDRSSRRRRAIRHMILNTPAFIPYLRPEIAAAYQPAPLYHTSPASMYL